MRIPFQKKTPRQIHGLGNADTGTCHQQSRHSRIAGPDLKKSVAPRSGEDRAMDSAMDSQGLAELPRAGAKIGGRLPSSSFPHGSKAAFGLQGPQQNKTPFARDRIPDHYIGHPMHPVVQIHIGRARRVLIDEAAGTGTDMGMAGFIVPFRVGFGLDNPTRTAVPFEEAPDQGPGGRNRW